MTTYSLGDCQRFAGTYCFHLQDENGGSETWVTFYQIIQRLIIEKSKYQRPPSGPVISFTSLTVCSVLWSNLDPIREYIWRGCGKQGKLLSTIVDLPNRSQKSFCLCKLAPRHSFCFVKSVYSQLWHPCLAERNPDGSSIYLQMSFIIMTYPFLTSDLYAALISFLDNITCNEVLLWNSIMALLKQQTFRNAAFSFQAMRSGEFLQVWFLHYIIRF
jgi:hypothetical protein